MKNGDERNLKIVVVVVVAAAAARVVNVVVVAAVAATGEEIGLHNLSVFPALRLLVGLGRLGSFGRRVPGREDGGVAVVAPVEHAVLLEVVPLHAAAEQELEVGVVGRLSEFQISENEKGFYPVRAFFAKKYSNNLNSQLLCQFFPHHTSIFWCAA